MTAFKLQLLFVTCVAILIPKMHGISQFPQMKDDTKWRVHKRQDIYSQPRYFMWKPFLPQVYNNQNIPLAHAPMTINYHRFAMPPVSPMLHHTNFILAIPTTKVNQYPYQSIKELGDRRKPHNFHHLAIINSIMPKPYMPPPTTPFQSGPRGLRHYKNNKQLFYYHIKPGQQITNASKSRIFPQHQSLESTSRALPVIPNQRPTQLLVSMANEQTKKQSNSSGRDYSKGSAYNCDKKTTSELTLAESHAPNYYCNILKYYQDVTIKRQTQQQVLPTTNRTIVEKPSRSDPGNYATQKDIFFTPTLAAHQNSSAETTTRIINEGLDFKPRPTFATTLPRNETQQHTFFTIEDAITMSAPRNYVFNDPYEAMTHARKSKENNFRRQRPKDSTVETTKNSFFTNFFDDNVDDPSDSRHFNWSQPHFSYKNESKATSYNRLPKFNKPTADSIGYKYNTIDVFEHPSTTPYSHIQPDRSTTLQPNEYDIGSEKKVMIVDEKTKPKVETFSTSTTVSYETKSSTSLPATEAPFPTTVVSTTTTTTTTTGSTKLKKSQLKYPFFLRPTLAYKYQKPTRGLFKSSKNTTVHSTTPSSTKKKPNKYQRQYKSKKSKHLRSSLQTISVPFTPTQSMTSTTVSTTTIEANNTKKLSYRTIAVTSTIEPVTAKTRKAQSARVTKKQSRSSPRLQGSKRKEKGRVSSTAKPRARISRRRSTTTSTTIKSPLISSSKTFPSTTTTTMASYTATTMKSTFRKSNIESKTKNSNSKIYSKMIPNEVYDASFTDNKQSTKSTKSFPTRDDMVPPLPIEIYFEKSQNVNM